MYLGNIHRFIKIVAKRVCTQKVASPHPDVLPDCQHMMHITCDACERACWDTCTRTTRPLHNPWPFWQCPFIGS